MKNKKAVILLLIANSISGFAQGITMLAIPWYFAKHLNATAVFGSIYFFTTIGTLFWGTYAGTLIDKYNRKKLFLGQNAIGFLILTFSAFYGFTFNELPVPIIALCFVVTVFIYNIHYPNLYAFAQEITPPRDYSKINSYLEIQGQTTSMIAGATAAVLLTDNITDQFVLFGNEINIPLHFKAWNIWEIFALDASTYLLAFIIIFFIRYKAVAKRHDESGNVIEQIKTGFRFLIQKPAIFIFGSLSYGIFVTILVGVYFLAPNYINDILNENGSIYALTDMSFALGAIFAGIFIRRLFGKLNTAKAIIYMMIIVAIFYFLLNSFAITALFVSGYLIVGLCNSGTRILRVTYLFERIPNQIIGRATSVFRIVNVLIRTFFIGIFSYITFFVENINYSYLALSIFLIVSVVIMLFQYRSFNEVEVINN